MLQPNPVLQLIDTYLLGQTTVTDVQVSDLYNAMSRHDFLFPSQKWARTRSFDRGAVSTLLALGPLISDEARHQALAQLVDENTAAAWGV